MSVSFYINEFKRIAAQEGGSIGFDQQTIIQGSGSASPHLEFLMQLEYKSVPIVIVNETGLRFAGNIQAKIPGKHKESEFNLTTRGHLETVFVGKSKRFKISAQHSRIANVIKHSEGFRQILPIAQAHAFEPQIQGIQLEDSFAIKTAYHLEFDRWSQAIEPLIQLYKEIIDAII